MWSKFKVESYGEKDHGLFRVAVFTVEYFYGRMPGNLIDIKQAEKFSKMYSKSQFDK